MRAFTWLQLRDADTIITEHSHEGRQFLSSLSKAATAINRVIRRHGRVYVINKTNGRFKARQG